MCVALLLLLSKEARLWCSIISPFARLSHLTSPLSHLFSVLQQTLWGVLALTLHGHTHTHTYAHAHWFAGISVVCNTRICMAIMQLIELFHYAGGPVSASVYDCVCVCLWQWHTPLYVSHVSFFNFFSRRKQNNSA